MASTAIIFEDNSTQTQGFNGLKGLIRTTGVQNINFKNIDDATSTYSSFPITAGNNSFTKFQYLWFSGSYNMISGVTFQHTGGNFVDTSIGLRGWISGSGFYTTPSTTTNATMVFNMSSTGLLSTGYAVLVGASGAEASGKTTFSSSSSVYTEYVGMQLFSTTSAPPGDTPTLYFAWQWTEN